MIKEYYTEGVLTFNPKAIRDPSGKMFKPWWVIVKVNDDIVEFYSWFLEREFGIKLQRPAFGAHVSLIRGEKPTNEKKWEDAQKKWEGTQLKLKYWSPPRTNGKHWWLRLSDESELENIREEIGYSKKGMWILHLTIGMPNPKYLDQSYYIWSLYKQNLLNYDYTNNK